MITERTERKTTKQKQDRLVFELLASLRLPFPPPRGRCLTRNLIQSRAPESKRTRLQTTLTLVRPLCRVFTTCEISPVNKTRRVRGRDETVHFFSSVQRPLSLAGEKQGIQLNICFLFEYLMKLNEETGDKYLYIYLFLCHGL